MYLPINGRVAIIDNEINEVKPLFQIFSKNRIPYVFFDASETEFLPDPSDENNDIRLLFLDINLVDKTISTEKQIRSTLIGVLKKVITPNNFPYLIILWSTQESEYFKLVEEIFDTDLKDRKPIGIHSFIKADYIPVDGSPIEEGDERIIEEIEKLFKSNPAYSTLIYWENKVHKSADITLQTIFSNYTENEWENNSKFIIEKLSQAYLGFKNHQDADYPKRIKSALQGFNNIFYDTIETQINLESNIESQDFFNIKEDIIDKDFIEGLLNFKLLASNIEISELDYTGVLLQDNNTETSVYSKSIFDKCMNFNYIDKYVKSLHTEISSSKLKKEVSNLKKEMNSTIKNCNLIVTPLCDKVQNKFEYVRLVRGFLIDKKYNEFINKTSEAIFISPSFYIDKDERAYVLLLDFRHLFTIHKSKEINDELPNSEVLFRLRSTIIAEIQSKLARHINRQGILYVE